MPRIKVVVLTDEQRHALEKGAKYHAAPSFRLRCQAVLLKSVADTPRTSAQVAAELSCCTMSVNDWVNRFEQEGVAGLQVKSGRGRPGILHEDDLAKVKAAVVKNRQKLSLAKAEIEQELGRPFGLLTLKRYLKKTVPLQTPATGSCGQPDPDMYQVKVEALSQWENLAEQGQVDVFYADESRVNLTPCVPYAWQFKDERVGLPSTSGGGLSCFALLARDCRCRFATTEQSLDARFIVEQLDRFSFELARPTVVVLDNAAIHRAKPVQARIEAWQARGLFVAYLPKYSPHLNIVEVLWRKLKYQWLCAEDYTDKPTLFYAVGKALAAVGNDLNIAFAPFKHRTVTTDTT